MAKDTYYFSHDHHARHDKKIKQLTKDYKSAGYGIFWATCEVLHEENNELEFDEITIEHIAEDLHEDPVLVSEIIEKCINKYKLFHRYEAKNEANEAEKVLHEANEAKKVLQSNRVHRNLSTKTEKKKTKSEAGKLGGLKSGEKRQSKDKNNENEAYVEAEIEAEIVLREANEAANQIKEIKEIKVDERKGNFNDGFFEAFRRCCGNHIKDDELLQEVGKFKNKYPNVHINQAGALINTWVSNIGRTLSQNKNASSFT